jgi:hypothetical protein
MAFGLHMVTTSSTYDDYVFPRFEDHVALN